MPVPNSANPAAANNQRAVTHKFTIVMAIKPTVTVKIGSLLQANTWKPTPNAEDGSYTPPYCELATTTANGLLLGVCSGSTTNGVAPVESKAGAITTAVITVWGYSLVRVNTTVAYGSFLEQGTVAGVAKKVTTALAGKGLGVSLQAFTYATVVTTISGLIKLT